MSIDELANGTFELDDAGVGATLEGAHWVSSANQRSTWFSQEPPVGVKCTW